MGATVAAHVEGAAQQTADALAARAADADLTSDPVAGPLVHERTGATLDPRTPVLVGAGQLVNRDAGPEGSDPASMSAEALRRAERGRGRRGPAGRRRRGLRRRERVLAVRRPGPRRRGGRRRRRRRSRSCRASSAATPAQLLLNDAGRRSPRARRPSSWSAAPKQATSSPRPRRPGRRSTGRGSPPATEPTRVLGKDAEANNDAEAAAGLGAPVYMYGADRVGASAPSRARRSPSTPSGSRELWSRLSEVAAENPYAWCPTAYTPERARDGRRRPTG